MATFISHSPEETFALGQKWGREAKAGTVFGLTGDLGSGKTQLIKGIALGLGASDRVHSPTYALLNQYSGGRLLLIHIDLYRLNGPADVIAAGLEEYLTRPPGVTVVEWIERWTLEGSNNQPLIRQITFEHLSECMRQITYDDALP